MSREWTERHIRELIDDEIKNANVGNIDYSSIMINDTLSIPTINIKSALYNNQQISWVGNLFLNNWRIVNIDYLDTPITNQDGNTVVGVATLESIVIAPKVADYNNSNGNKDIMTDGFRVFAYSSNFGGKCFPNFILDNKYILDYAGQNGPPNEKMPRIIEYYGYNKALDIKYPLRTHIFNASFTSIGGECAWGVSFTQFYPTTDVVWDTFDWNYIDPDYELYNAGWVSTYNLANSPTHTLRFTANLLLKPEFSLGGIFY